MMMDVWMALGFVVGGVGLGAGSMGLVMCWLGRGVDVCGRGQCAERVVQMQLYPGMAEEELVKHLREISYRPGWDAVMQLLDRECVERMGQGAAHADGMAEGEVKYALGGVQALLELKAELKAYAKDGPVVCPPEEVAV